MTEEAKTLLGKIRQLLSQGKLKEAQSLCRQITLEHPNLVDGWMLASQLFVRRKELTRALEFAQKACAVDTQHLGAKFLLAECLSLDGQTDQALMLLEQVETLGQKSYEILQGLGLAYTHIGVHQKAYLCFKESIDRKANDPVGLFNYAVTLDQIGDFRNAETILNQVIALNPRDIEAYALRSKLKKQTMDDNHIAQMEKALAEFSLNEREQCGLHFTLSKEFEDLENYDQSFAYLQKGAGLRRQNMQYKVNDDVEFMNQLCDTFTEDLLSEKYDDRDGSQAIFVLGLPRSGTTLVERILSSHSQIESLGEIQDFALALMKTASSANIQNKFDLLAHTAAIDFRKLGANYLSSTAKHKRGQLYFIDKTPHNFLYMGLIALSLPRAKIIHVQRNPMDSCYAMYKTLFGSGYPYSYDLKDLAEYYIAYDRLMRHWRQVLPHRFFDIDYENLVLDQAGQSRLLISHCGLNWEEQCLKFYENNAPSATASSVQVRQAIHPDSVNKWQCYSNQLEPLAQSLRKAGIRID